MSSSVDGARVAQTAGLVEQHRELLTTASQERRTWAAFSLVTFSLAAQEKVTSRRAAPGQRNIEEKKE